MLGIAVRDIDESFFHYGGHSLLAVKALCRIEDRLQVGLPLGELFRHPTVRGLAARVEALRR